MFYRLTSKGFTTFSLHERGFTLIELLVAISIIAVLSTVGITTYQGIQAKARDSVRKNDLNKLSTALELYFQKNNKYVPPANTTDPDSCSRDTANFYTAIAPFVSGSVPQDPQTRSNYCYISVNNGQSYRLFAKLEKPDPQGNPIYNYSNYNYSLASTDLALAPAPSDSVSPTATPAPSASPTPTATPTPTPAPTSTPALLAYNPKVLLLIYNPILESQGSKTLVAYKNWNDPDTLTSSFISSIKAASGNLVNYTIAERIVVDGFPVKTDGFQYTDDTYLTCVNSGGSSCHSSDLASYLAMINQVDACTKRNNGQIDELWIWGGPWFGYYESNLTGPNAFWYNSSPTTGTTCTKLLPIMGFNYERGEAEMFEDLGHRTESTMKQVYGSWVAGYNVTSATAQTDWDKYSILDNQNPGNGGCGNAHTAFNSDKISGAYDRENTRTVLSRCKIFANYPNLTGASESLNCNAWGCTALGYFKNWFFKYLPRATGTTNGKLNNWWAYLVDPQDTVGVVQGVSTQAAVETNLQKLFKSLEHYLPKFLF